MKTSRVDTQAPPIVTLSPTEWAARLQEAARPGGLQEDLEHFYVRSVLSRGVDTARIASIRASFSK